jgi:hypothetical protein
VTRARLVDVVLALLGLDLLGVVVTGGLSLLAGGPVGAVAVALRACALSGLVAWRFGRLPPPERRMQGGTLLLLALLFPALAQFQILGRHLSGDGISYYVYVRSLVKDRDFDLTNEYDHYGMLGRWDLAVTTRTGLRRSIYSIGPAVLSTPFFLLGDVAARVEGALTGIPPDLSGYGRHYVDAVALGNLLYGFVGLLLIHSLLRRHFPSGIALGSTLLVWGATFFHWYLVVQPTYAHSASTLLAAYFLWLWDRDRADGPGAWASFYQGLVLGIGMSVRWQNGVLLLLPGIDAAAHLLRDRAAAARLTSRSALLAVGALVGTFPQMAAWKALYGEWLLPCPPHGCDFVRLDHPFVLETLFASRHGLLSWTPALWAGYVGLLPLARRRPTFAAVLAAPIAVMTYVNMCAGDWWAGASFSNRRFDSVLPLLAFGVAACLAALLDLFRRRPGLGAAAVVAPFVLWTIVSGAAVGRGAARRNPVAFSNLAGAAARATSEAVGFPTTWPASWIFAARHDVSPGRYDLTVGRYLFYRQNSFGPRLAMARADVAPLLDGDWREPTAVLGRPARCIFARARLFVPLDVPASFELRFAAAAPGGGRRSPVTVNGHPVGVVAAGPEWRTTALAASRELWHREINEVSLEPVEGAGPLCVASIEFVRPSRKGGRGR